MSDPFIDNIVLAHIYNKKIIMYVWITGKNSNGTYIIREPGPYVSASDYLLKKNSDFGKEYTMDKKSKVFKILTKKQAHKWAKFAKKILKSKKKKKKPTTSKKKKNKQKNRRSRRRSIRKS